jgi:hypothetical protein
VPAPADHTPSTSKPILTLTQGLFTRIGPVSKLVLLYDRAGRSEGVAYVTYEEPEDARAAIREFDGANANGKHPASFLARRRIGTDLP